MKKLLLILTAILAVLAGLLSIMDRTGEYSAERLFHKAMEIQKNILKNPDVVPPIMAQRVEKNLSDIVEKFPSAQTAKIAYITLAEVYITNKKYNDAFLLLDEFAQKYKDETVLLSRAQFLKGLAYERKGDWDAALKEYNLLNDKYNNTPLGVQMPLYIAQYYQRQGMAADTENAFNKAIRYYEIMEDNNKGTIFGYTCAGFIVKTYLAFGKYEEAGDAIQNVVLKNYPADVIYMQYLELIYNIFVNKLNKPDRAVEIYKNILASAKHDNLKKALDKLIGQLEEKINNTGK